MQPRKAELFSALPYYSKLVGALPHFIGPALVNEVGMLVLPIEAGYGIANSGLAEAVRQ